MSKGIYSEEVTFEEIKFDADLKKEVKEKKLVSGSDVRLSRDDKGNETYYQQRAVGNQGMKVEEGQYIVSFSDGRQKLMNADEFKKSVKPSKGKDEDAADNGPVGVLPLSDGTQQLLTKEQTESLAGEASKATAEGTAKNDQGKTNPVAPGNSKSSNSAK